MQESMKVTYEKLTQLEREANSFLEIELSKMEEMKVNGGLWV